jgi:mycothiol synthase
MNMENLAPTREFVIPGPFAPEIPGLRFRAYRGESDLPAITEIWNATAAADQAQEVFSLDEVTREHRDPSDFDLHQDILIVEVDGKMIGYSRVRHRIEETSRDGLLILNGYILPEWRRRGLGRAMLRHNEHRLREVAVKMRETAAQPLANIYFQTYATNFQPGANALALSEGYLPIRHSLAMRRPNLEDIPDAPLPEGLEVRPVMPEHARQIWDASQEAFQDHWGYTQSSEQDFDNWRTGIEFQPEVWQVAWDGDQIAGMVLNFILRAENESLGIQRGYTEGISVRRPWRRRGLARALLARSLRMHRDLGMTETCLGVDAENPNGARQLYESMGYQIARTFTIYRKELKQGA